MLAEPVLGPSTLGMRKGGLQKTPGQWSVDLKQWWRPDGNLNAAVVVTIPPVKGEPLCEGSRRNISYVA